jgi:hypothetical protein
MEDGVKSGGVSKISGLGLLVSLATAENPDQMGWALLEVNPVTEGIEWTGKVMAVGSDQLNVMLGGESAFTRGIEAY